MTLKTAMFTCALLCVALAVCADEAWDAREARQVRARYGAIDHLPDFAQIKDTFEKGLAGDASAATALTVLVKHANDDVAEAAAQMLGRFPSTSSSTALKESYANDARIFVRANALAGLARMRDPATAPLSIAALQGDDEAMQGAGLGALEALEDAAYSSSILGYYARHPEQLNADALQSLGELGDPLGSTAVRDRLVAEANNKRNDFDLRYGAALGLSAMGQASLVKPILDIENARDTNSNLIVVKGEMESLAEKRGITVKSQGEVDVLLRDIAVQSRTRIDLWKRPLRAKYVSPSVFQVISDGPDMTPDTTDDMSTAEPYQVYIHRIFPDQFLRP